MPSATSASCSTEAPCSRTRRARASRARRRRSSSGRPCSSRGSPTGPSRRASRCSASDGQIRLQWDAGAPGIVCTATDYLDEELLLAGAELVWQAGAHGAEKGSGLCHGTAGNGYALLSTFGRTQDERWLERARRFAVHALEQAGRARDVRGRGRYSLWTGDVGVALYAADCLDGRARYPILGGWS